VRSLAICFIAAAAITGMAARQTPELKVTVRSHLEAPTGGLAGTMSPLWGGANGFVVEITLKGSRLVTDYPSPERGATAGSWIVDFDEQQTYRLFPNTREYSVKKVP
jgi:hypothetical protein